MKNIVYMYGTGLITQQKIANIYKVGQDLISLIINKKRWKYIWGEVRD